MNNIFPKNISKKIINEFIGDYETIGNDTFLYKTMIIKYETERLDKLYKEKYKEKTYKIIELEQKILEVERENNYIKNLMQLVVFDIKIIKNSKGDLSMEKINRIVDRYNQPSLYY